MRPISSLALVALGFFACNLQDGKPPNVASEGEMRIRFSSRDWMNVVMDSLVITDDSPQHWLHASVTRFNPYFQDANITLKAYPGQSFNLIARFYKMGRVVAQASATVVTTEAAILDAGNTSLIKMPAWDSLIPEKVGFGHLSFAPKAMEIAVPVRLTDTLNVWNRTDTTIGFSVLAKDAWVKVTPDTVLAMNPGDERKVILSVDSNLVPAARIGGQIVFRTESALDTLPVRYRSSLAPGKAWLRLRVISKPTGLPIRNVAISEAPNDDSNHFQILNTDGFGEAMDLHPNLGLKFLTLKADSSLTLFDTTTVSDNDTTMRELSMEPVPQHPAFNFGLGATALSPIFSFGDQWVVASKSLNGEGLIAYAPAGSTTTGTVKTLRQGNVDSTGAPMLMQGMATVGSNLYLTYPTESKMVRISGWRGLAGYQSLDLSFQPFHLLQDSNFLAVTGADALGSAVLAFGQADSFPNVPTVSFPGMRATGVNLGLWGPVVAIMDAGHLGVMAQDSNDRGRFTKVAISGTPVQEGPFLNLNGCDGKSLLIVGPHLLCLDADAKNLIRYDFEGRQTGSLALPWVPKGLHIQGSAMGRRIAAIEGRQGEWLWVDAMWMKVCGGDQ